MMNLEDALGSDQNVSSGQPSSNPTWPGGQPTNPAWPGGQPTNPAWPGGQPTNPAWPGGQPTNPAWPGGQPTNPTWPGGPSTNPTWPGGQPTNPTWPGGQPTNPTWPGGQPTNPTWPGGQAGGGGPSAPGGWPSPTVGPGPGPTIPVAPQRNLATPFRESFPNGVYDNLLITIGGTIKPNADKVTVDIGASRDLAFHFNPRFNEGGKKVIVRNSFINNKWGKEERELQRFPFIQGQPFEMKILCTTKEFKVAVNNSHLLTYQHRITNLRSINSIHIYNDLTLSNFNIETLS